MGLMIGANGAEGAIPQSLMEGIPIAQGTQGWDNMALTVEFPNVMFGKMEMIGGHIRCNRQSPGPCFPHHLHRPAAGEMAEMGLNTGLLNK
jgi:hypothetical protein